MIGGGIRPMDPMVKMYISLGAICMMVASSLLITYARQKTRGFVRVLLSTVAIVVFIITLPYMIISLL